MRFLTLLFFGFAAAFASAAEWNEVTVPDVWRKVPSGDLTPVNGFSWYRAFVRIPQEWRNTDLILVIEALDDARSGWVNGSEVGVNGRFPPTFRSGLGAPGRFQVPAALIRPGKLNCIAIRVYQSDPRVNFNVAPPVLLNAAAKQAIRMNGRWQYRPGDYRDSVQPAEDEIISDAGAMVFAKVDSVTDIDSYIARRDGDRPPLPPNAAAAAFEIPSDLKIDRVLSEPDITQPLFMTWDERGRLWVMEYRQYPNPAGLKMVSRDIYLRSVYDKVPEPPPHGVRGQDRISIHEDTDGDGLPDMHTVFVDGLNIATSFAIGRGGVFVTNPPYLLFYPDADGDDIPDRDPDVLLEGFGLQDTHSVINSLRFGPDGWLYGAQGSTVTAQVRQPGSTDPPIQTMGQQIWRYHPETKQFEVFAEGGGNTFGVEIDAWGRIYSGHNGGNTRGFHYVQGGYYRKGFAKHGELSNPYTFGFFEAMQHHDVPRFTHNFVIYESDGLPQAYQGQLFGIEPLQGQVVQSEVAVHQSSFSTRDVDRVVRTTDPWFRPVDIKTGPDGAIYIADMYEQRIDHSSHYAGRVDRSNGRIWRLRSTEQQKTIRPVDRSRLADALLGNNAWERQSAVRLLGDAPHPELIPKLRQQVRQEVGVPAVTSLWGLAATGGLDEETALQLLDHVTPDVRLWTVRLLTDTGQGHGRIADRMMELATSDPSIHVRKQLAASARRMAATEAVPILSSLMQHDVDSGDIHQPLMIWWAIENHIASAGGRDLLQSSLLHSPQVWSTQLFRDHIAERLIRRLVQSGRREEMELAGDLLQISVNHDLGRPMLAAVETALKAQSMATLPDLLLKAIDAAGGGSEELQLSQQKPAAIQTALQVITDEKADPARRSRLLRILGELRLEEALPSVQQVLSTETNPIILTAALNAAADFSNDQIGQVIVDRLSSLPEDLQSVATAVLSTRSSWTFTALQATVKGTIDQTLFRDRTLRRMLQHPDPAIREMIEAQWGDVRGATSTEMAAEAVRIREILTSGSGNPKQGKKQYTQNCGRCHRLFGEGGQVGPDLTPFQRDDLARLLPNIVNPDLEIREGFENFLVVTNDGQLAAGFLSSQDKRVIVLRSAEGVSRTFFREEIDEMTAVPESVMPKGTLKTLTDQQIRNLFAYLRASQPVNY